MSELQDKITFNKTVKCIGCQKELFKAGAVIDRASEGESKNTRVAKIFNRLIDGVWLFDFSIAICADCEK